MASGKMRSTRRLRAWIEEQVNSGKYPGLVWDDEFKSRFRIPWKHAGKQDFRQDEDAAIFKAWAEFKSKGNDGEPKNAAAYCKTRLRCALNKSPEFQEVTGRAQLDISEPYKVYRLVPLSEQGCEVQEKKVRGRPIRRSKRNHRSDSEDEDVSAVKHIKTEQVTSLQGDAAPPRSDSQHNEQHLPSNAAAIIRSHNGVNEFQLNMSIEEVVVPPAARNVQDSFAVSVFYLGQRVLECPIHRPDVRITYLPSAVVPTPGALNGRFPPVPLPEPSSLSLPAGAELLALSTLLPFMERGVLLTSLEEGVYGKRYCQGRVFWSGPGGAPAAAAGLNKMERNSNPELLFSKDAFRRQLDHFRVNGGDPPQCGVTLCFGEELSEDEDLSKKLIIVKVMLPWAEQQVKESQSVQSSISFLQSLASQSPLGEITLDLVLVSPPPSD